MTIDPYGIDVVSWTDFMSFELVDTVVVVMKLENPEDWQEWARNVLESPELSELNVPSPEYFSDWREWVVEFNKAYERMQ